MQSFDGKNLSFKTFKIFYFLKHSGLKGGPYPPDPTPGSATAMSGVGRNR